MNSRVIRRHDQFFKLLLDQPGAAGTLLRERLPVEVSSRLSAEDPELVNTSFVDAELRERRADRLYRVRLRDGRQALIYVLVEHKSAPDPRIGLQLLIYMVRIWEWWERHEGKDANGKPRLLPVILPLVVYHGHAEWRVPLDFADGFDVDDDTLRPYLVDFRYSLADLGRIDDAALSDQNALRVGLLILKHGDGGGDIRETLLRLGRAEAALGVDDLAILVRYIIAEPNKIEPGLLRDVLKEIVPGQETRIMSIAAEMWKAEGMADGIKIGQAQGKVQGKAEGKAEILLRQFRRRFRTVPEAVSEKVLHAHDDDLNMWAENILDASSLDMVFSPRKSN
ncbi:hypothetical protein N825_36975 [Skermanella stibiiresistens SB22]|uniref:Uncharacterized protein n=1 Tax=Skermanella stibiiresistens SB22 TaxID=1385369 RepID=W9H2V9_9PROT|nr:Rpn family recombination-promoting nuclease/putative transposase [Skermanella stibiiresistens]EWY40399.1 hypothetical protein N825_36975 [Skermanella stibiiresistens SB22]